MFKRYCPDRCYVIAEIGGNFHTADEARRLVDAAAEIGVDAVKLQTYKAETLASRAAMFDMENTGVVSQYALMKSLEIDERMHRTVFEYAAGNGLDWFSTPSHADDVELLERMHAGAYKIGSDDAVNWPLLRRVAQTGKPILLSTGMCTLKEVHDAVDVLDEARAERVILLHAITSYPTHPRDVNLGAMQTLMREFPTRDVGYSDHTLDPLACLCAAAMGARVVERHFTLDKAAAGPDHALSADPAEMKWLVDAIRRFEVMKGSGIKQPAGGEGTTRINNRKSVVLTRAVSAGQRLTAADLAIKRPGTGIAPANLTKVAGRVLRADMPADSVLTWDDLI